MMCIKPYNKFLSEEKVLWTKQNKTKCIGSTTGEQTNDPYGLHARRKVEGKYYSTFKIYERKKSVTQKSKCNLNKANNYCTL